MRKKTAHADLMKKLQKLTAARLNIGGGPKVEYIESVCQLLRQSRIAPEYSMSPHFSSGCEEELELWDFEPEIQEDDAKYCIKSTWQRSLELRKPDSPSTPAEAGRRDFRLAQSAETDAALAAAANSVHTIRVGPLTITHFTFDDGPPSMEGELPARP